MKKLFILALFVIVAQTAFAGSTSLYVNNQPYSKPVLNHKNHVFVVLQDIASLLNMRMVAQGRVFCVATQDFSFSPCPVDVVSAPLYVNGHQVSDGVMLYHGKIWISVVSLARILGYTYAYNPQTQIADLAAPTLQRNGASNQSQSAQAGKDAGGKQPAEQSKESKDPLQVSNLNWFQDTRTYEIRLSFDVTNVSSKTVNKIVATLEYKDGYGKPVRSVPYNIGTLETSQSVSETDYWINASEIVVHPDVTFDWEGKKKQ